MNLYQKLAKARVELQKKDIKKTGVNKYSGFNYFDLKDFLPEINAIFNELGLLSQFRIEKQVKAIKEEVEITIIAKLTIYNAEKPEEQIEFISPVAEAGMKGATPIQQVGAMHTYMRRYLWLEAMEIVESDDVDATSGKDDTATENQIGYIKKYYIGENLVKLCKKYEVNRIEEITKAKASEIIDNLKNKSNSQLHQNLDVNNQESTF